MVTGLRIPVNGSVQKVEIPKSAILTGLYAAISCDAVDVVRLADQLDMWIDDYGLYNAQVNPLATKLAHHFQHDIPARLPATLLRHRRDPRNRRVSWYMSSIVRRMV
jgi:hypothetical protein